MTPTPRPAEPRAVDAAWEALYEELVPMGPAVLGWTGIEGGIIARHRPAIEAAIRAESSAEALDATGLLAKWDGYNGDSLMGELYDRRNAIRPRAALRDEDAPEPRVKDWPKVYVHPVANLDLDTLAYVRESMVGIEAVGGTVRPIALIDSIVATRAEVRGESHDNLEREARTDG
jgi:hypothetical protein